MKLILIEGGPASGKNTLGELLVKKMSAKDDKTILLDHDTYIEEYNPKWIWDNEEQRTKDHLNAGINFYKDINMKLEAGLNVIAIGDKWMTDADIDSVVSKMNTKTKILLFHLSVPFEVRERRLHLRGPHSLIDLVKNQRDKDANKTWPGYVYNNINSPEVDAENLFSLIQQDRGLIQ
jgi:predicted kinase